MNKVRKSKVGTQIISNETIKSLKHILVRGQPPISTNDLCNYMYNNNYYSDKCL